MSRIERYFRRVVEKNTYFLDKDYFGIISNSYISVIRGLLSHLNDTIEEQGLRVKTTPKRLVIDKTSLQTLEILGQANKWGNGTTGSDAEVTNAYSFPVEGTRKSAFFKRDNYLRNLGLKPIKNKIGKYYTMESQVLLSSAYIISGELIKRLWNGQK
jgi:hypothetical protein